MALMMEISSSPYLPFISQFFEAESPWGAAEASHGRGREGASPPGGEEERSEDEQRTF